MRLSRQTWPRLIEAEAAAGEMCREVGMPAIAEDTPGDRGIARVVAERPLVGVRGGRCDRRYISADIGDGNANIGQV